MNSNWTSATLEPAFFLTLLGFALLLSVSFMNLRQLLHRRFGQH